MNFPLEPEAVKQVMEARLKEQPYKEQQFEFYHLHRNHFNVKTEVTTLNRIGEKQYRDNLGNVWQEQPVFKNFFHMPTFNWLGSLLGLVKPYSRKFLRDDTETGVGGEFELVIRKDGKRIDGLVHQEYQETYNFAPTRNFSAHKELDVDPHNRNDNYAIKMDMGRIEIIE